MSLKIKILPAESGDLQIIEVDDKVIVIDSGTKNTYSKGIFKHVTKTLNKIDLLILTHVDEDHIGGLIRMFEDNDRKKNLIGEVWFNSPMVYADNNQIDQAKKYNITISDPDEQNMSIGQGLTIEKFLSLESSWSKKIISAGDFFQFQGAKIEILSPEREDLATYLDSWEIENSDQLEMSNKKDYHLHVSELLTIPFKERGSIANKTSIAFLLSYNNHKFLFMGDAFSSIVEKRLRNMGFNEENKLALELVKLSHHGSKFGLGDTLLSMIKCNSFIISTDGRHGHPNKECLSKVVQNSDETSTLYFNHNNEIMNNIFTQEETEFYKIRSVFLDKENKYIACEIA